MIANARMYSITPTVNAAWKDLLRWVLREADLDWDVIDHSAPSPLGLLWDRADMGCAFMCGLPFANRYPQVRAIAAPVPIPARYHGRPVYCTDLVVRADAPFEVLEDTFGGRLAYTNEESQSGYSAVRNHLLKYRDTSRVSFYRGTIGPLVTPRRVLEAVIDGSADVGPLDSYAHDLFRLHEPELTRQLKVIASTARTPIPLLVAAAGVGDAVIGRLRAAFLEVRDAEAMKSTRETLLLKEFALIDPVAYETYPELVRNAQAANYPHLA